jgi:GH35 family endo-1,4-beta-xylanase
MIEHPIEQPGGMSNTVTLSDDLIERASRLMGTKKVTEQVVAQSSPSNTLNTSNTSDMKEMMKSVVKEVLKENGMLIESVERTNDNFKFQVGNHIFEGKLTKIKKLK